MNRARITTIILLSLLGAVRAPGQETSAGHDTGSVKVPGQEKGQVTDYPDTLMLQEAVVVAKETKGVTAASTIGKEAIKHIQPTSLQDILELLPGGIARDPVLASPQPINLRSAAGISSNYATSALGTAVMVDGKPVGINAGLGTNAIGTDLRTISTDDIQSVEVVRGIASVEYGDLTSGLMKIIRRKGGSDLRARFKADMTSKLVYMGKDFEWGSNTLNAGIGYLDSQSDPRNPRQNYKRITGSFRAGKTWIGDYRSALDLSLDYTGSFDDVKSDQDLDFGSMGPVETYKASYNKFEAAASYSLSAAGGASFFRRLYVNGSFTIENDVTDRWKYVVNGAEQPLMVAKEPGEQDAIILPTRYESTYLIKSVPVYGYLSAVADFATGNHKLKAGAQWTLDKNLGEGEIFDVTRPYSTLSSTRPRPYYAIPANHQVSVFAEDSGKAPLGDLTLEWVAGVRVSALAGAGSAFDINFKPYADPRANLRVNIPGGIGIYVGGGLHTKFPTMDMLYPNPLYGDIQEFNYWPVERELRRSYGLVYVVDPTNYELKPARNAKFEIGADFSRDGFEFTIDWFYENMTSGFRNSSRYGAYEYKRFDGSGIDKSTLTAPPAVESLPYVLDTVLRAHGITSNGSQTLKQGVEFTFTSPRIAAINSRITANGAWFITKNTNSVPLYYVPTAIISGSRYDYVGYYQNNEGSTYTCLNTNIMLDTQIPQLGLIVSTSLQTAWFSNHHPVLISGRPISYLDKNLVEHPFTDADAEDPVLKYLVRNTENTAYNYLTPFETYLNIKATKNFREGKMSLSLFVNRLLGIAPDYWLNGSYVRRATTPYFGMELNFKI